MHALSLLFVFLIIRLFPQKIQCFEKESQNIQNLFDFIKVHFFEYAFRWKSVVRFDIIILHYLSRVNILCENYGKTSTENKFKKVYFLEQCRIFY